MRVTHDPVRRTLLVSGLEHHAWMLLRLVGKGRVLNPTAEMIAANIEYIPVITGAPSPTWANVDAAWRLAAQRALDLHDVPRATHDPKTRMNRRVALVLAIEARIAEFGHHAAIGANGLDAAYHALTVDDQRLLARRKRGAIVL